MMKFCGYSKFQTKIIHKQGGFVYTIEIYTNYYSSKSIYFRYTFTINKGYLIYPKDISSKKADIKMIYN